MVILLFWISHSNPTSYVKEKSISTVNAVDVVIFADKATSAALKEMMGLFLVCMIRKKTKSLLSLFPSLPLHELNMKF